MSIAFLLRGYFPSTGSLKLPNEHTAQTSYVLRSPHFLKVSIFTWFETWVILLENVVIGLLVRLVMYMKRPWGEPGTGGGGRSRACHAHRHLANPGVCHLLTHDNWAITTTLQLILTRCQSSCHFTDGEGSMRNLPVCTVHHIQSQTELGSLFSPRSLLLHHSSSQTDLKDVRSWEAKEDAL